MTIPNNKSIVSNFIKKILVFVHYDQHLVIFLLSSYILQAQLPAGRLSGSVHAVLDLSFPAPREDGQGLLYHCDLHR